MQFYAHGITEFLHGHLFHLSRRIGIGLLLCQHLPKAVLTHHGHLIVQQHRYQQVAVQFVQIFARQTFLSLFSVIGILPLLFFAFRHEKLGVFEFFCRDLFRQNVFHAAVLDSGVNNIRSVLRQGQVTKCPYHQQHQDQQHGTPVGFQIFEKFTHWSLSLLSFPPVPLRPPHRAAEAVPSAGRLLPV